MTLGEIFRGAQVCLIVFMGSHIADVFIGWAAKDLQVLELEGTVIKLRGSVVFVLAVFMVLERSLLVLLCVDVVRTLDPEARDLLAELLLVTSLIRGC